MKIIELYKTCSTHPAQWEGKLENGTVLYVRFRNGMFSSGSGADVEEAVSASLGHADLLDEPDDDSMTTGRMLGLLAPKGFEFEGVVDEA